MTITLIVIHPGLLKSFAKVTYSDGSSLITSANEGERLARQHNAKGVK
jgi:hypothetical protein